MRCLFLLLVLLVPFGTVSHAQSRDALGEGRLFTNDFFGDGRDRYQTGSYVHSFVRGPSNWDRTPLEFGSIREYRLRSAIMASDGIGDAPGDRPYAGALSLGVHSHFGQDTFRGTVGVDVTAIGPQTGLSRFQERAHDQLGLAQVRFTDSQLGNAFHLGLTAEAAENVQLTDFITARPFAELQIGPEDVARFGADVVLGRNITSDILIRDVTTGHLYHGTETADSGFAFVLGADLAAVADSAYFPAERGVVATDRRGRLRAGMHWQSESDTSVFYGLSYLTPEFEGQPEGQLTGSLKLNFNF
ncbi:MAG: lipid A-modifier LpxR family protein [Yoonia sp.]|uniref:lipid A-modifier LpxR family protein n=1 Tax=Yoonia sp. TaxID=2212373 RepID=UPI0032655AF1